MHLYPNYRSDILLHTCSAFRIDLKLNIFTILLWVFTLNQPIRRNMFGFYLTLKLFLRYFYTAFVWFLCENRSYNKFLYAVMRASHTNAFVIHLINKVDWTAVTLTISKTSQGSILAEAGRKIRKINWVGNLIFFCPKNRKNN